MNAVEREKLEQIPSRIDNGRILNLVTYVSHSEAAVYFVLLKLVSKEDDKTLSDWLSVTEKTYRTYKNEGVENKALLTEHTIMVLALYKHGARLFGSFEQFTKWLRTENFFFDNKAPIDFIGTASGVTFIDDRLTGMEYGDNA